MSSQLLFTEAEWNAAMPDVVRQMTSHLRPFRAPVFEDFGDHAKGWGSGSFIRLGEQVFILTNEHVAIAREQGRKLITQFDGQEDFRGINGNHASEPWPFDLAVLRVDNAAWKDTHHLSRAIEIDRIDLAHAPVVGELFTFCGFSGQEVKFLFGAVASTSTCYTCTEVNLPQGDASFDVRFHLGLAYNPNLATDVIGKKGLPVPNGLSGSTLWNTRFVQAKMAGQQWTPEMATVTGVVWGWPSSEGFLVATRAEYVHSFLLAALDPAVGGALTP